LLTGPVTLEVAHSRVARTSKSSDLPASPAAAVIFTEVCEVV
jgi:hypothetical protein